MWLRQFLLELGFPPSTPTIIYENNTVHNGNDKDIMKYMNIRYHYIRESSKFTDDCGYLDQTTWLQFFPAHRQSLLGNLAGGVHLMYILTLKNKLYFIKFRFMFNNNNINMISNFVFAYILILC